MNALKGTGALVRLALRLDRVRLPAWIVGISFLVVITASSFDQLFQDARDRAVFAAGVANNASFKALYGPAFDLSSTGGLTAWRIAGTAAAAAGLMSLLLMVRHTRTEEEAGRSELLGATVLGRYAGIVSALIVVGLANLGITALIALGLAGVGLPVPGSVGLGAAIGLTGCVFGALAAVTAQVATSARAAAGTPGVALGGAFVLRAAGDVGDGTLSWLSPVGWAQRLQSFAGERWWVLGLSVLATLVAALAALALVSRRDQGEGLITARVGPEHAPAGLRSAWGLAWRLQRGVLLGWALGLAAVGAVTGSVAKDIADIFAGNEQFAEILRRAGGANDLVDSFLGAVVGLLALGAGGYMIQAVLRIRSEEVGLRAEFVLATSVGRWSWAGTHLACAALGAAAIMATGGLALGAVHGLRAGDATQVPELMAAGLAQVPAVWVLGGLAFALTGVRPRLVGVAWAALAWCVALAQIGELVDLPNWALDSSPFVHAPQLPAAELTVAPVAALVAIAAGLVVLGLIGIRRRDIV